MKSSKNVYSCWKENEKKKKKKSKPFWAQEVIIYSLVMLAWGGLSCRLNPLLWAWCFGAAKALLRPCSSVAAAASQTPQRSSKRSWARATHFVWLSSLVVKRVGGCGSPPFPAHTAFMLNSVCVRGFSLVNRCHLTTPFPYVSANTNIATHEKYFLRRAKQGWQRYEATRRTWVCTGVEINPGINFIIHGHAWIPAEEVPLQSCRSSYPGWRKWWSAT